jgi:hypothetical protein
MDRRAPPPHRGPAAARGDAGRPAHNLYVKVVTGDDADRKSHEITLAALKYIHSRMSVFAQMGIAVKVNKIRSQDLQNPRLVEAMRRRGITRLPALTTSNNVYTGLKEISDIYEQNIKEFTAVKRRDERAVEGAAPDDDLDSYYKNEMSFVRAEEDNQETGIGEAEDMMDAYRRMVERREASRPPPAGRPAATTGDVRARPPPPGGARPDNVGSGAAGRRAAPSNAEDAEIQETIDRLARDIDEVRDRAFASGGGDSFEDDGGADPQDDLMERAYWGNQNESI